MTAKSTAHLLNMRHKNDGYPRSLEVDAISYDAVYNLYADQYAQYYDFISIEVLNEIT